LLPNKNLKLMWQRIQTIYLAIATLLIASLFFCNVTTIFGAEGAVEHVRYTQKVIYLTLIIIGTALAILCLATYKVRLLQMRLSILTGLILIGLEVVLAVDFFVNRGEMVFSFTAIFPLIAAILCFMASRKIMQDEIMVRASSRLRDTRNKRRRHNN